MGVWQIILCSKLDHQEGTKKGNAVLEPIYVSLYGLKETSQITEAIDRALRPFLYSKGAE